MRELVSEVAIASTGRYRALSFRVSIGRPSCAIGDGKASNENEAHMIGAAVRKGLYKSI
jgi:hypothetical protein